MDSIKESMQRTRLLLGDEALRRMERQRVIIIGVGGVGSWCAESLVRSGVGHLTIVDSDRVSASNINRQLMATASTVGQPKVDVLRRRLLDIRPEADVRAVQRVYAAETADSFQLDNYDFIIDAIDTRESKILLLQRACQTQATLFSSMGAALKMDPSRIRVDDFWRVKCDPMARQLRKQIRRAGVALEKPFLCVYSDEMLDNHGEPSDWKDTDTNRRINGTIAHITAIFGLTLASLVVRQVAGEDVIQDKANRKTAPPAKPPRPMASIQQPTRLASINAGGRLLDLGRPVVMGIVNATPDSFHAASRATKAEQVAEMTRRMRDEGATIIDVGACSTRPGAPLCSEEEERERLAMALPAVFGAWPEAVVSVDTFRPAVARYAVEQLGAHILNDVGSGNADAPDPTVGGRALTPMMAEAVRLRVPYVMMSRQPSVDGVCRDLAERVRAMRAVGHTDIILDPGFGFGRSREEDLALLSHLDHLQVLGLPVLVGLSRKRMACQPLGIKAEEALNATTVLNTLALERGASILRVHDVRPAVEAVRLVTCCTFCDGASDRKELL